MSDTPNYNEPSGSAQERLDQIAKLEDGEAAKAAEQPFYENLNYGMLGADAGLTTLEGTAAGLSAAGTALAGGATGGAALGAGAIAAGTAMLPLAIAVGGAWALDKVGVTGWLSKEFTQVGDALGLTIGRGDPHPACVGDRIAHSSGFMGILTGIAVGVAVGVAVAATVATGGLAGALIVGACMAGGLTLGGALASASQSMGSNCGEIVTGSGNVYFEGKKVARVTDLVKCDHHSGEPQALVEGSKTVFVNGLPLVRIGHETHCSGKVNSGRNSIWIDKTTGQYGPKNPELSATQEFLAGLLGGVVGGGIGRFSGKGLRGKFRPESARSAEQKGVNDETRPKCEDPVDPVSGEVLEIRTDLLVPGTLPIELKRRYRTRSDDAGLLGARWSDTWSRRLTLERGRFAYFHDGAGLALGFDASHMALDSINLRAPRYRLVGSRVEPRLLDRDTRQILIFSPLVDGQVSRLECIQDMDGNAITFRYDGQSRLSTLTHSDGYRLDVVYDSNGRMPGRIVLHEVGGGTRTLVEYRYRDVMLSDVTSFQFGQLHYAYDDHGWMTQWGDSDQTNVHYRYDTAGRVVETGTEQGYHTGRFFYEEHRTRVIDADGERIFEYNDDGLVIAETDPLGHCTRSEWALGRLILRTDPLGRRTDYDYNDHGLLIAVREATGRAIGFEYNDAQLLVGATLPDGAQIKLEYDHVRRLVARIEPDGTTTRYRYGKQGELLRIVHGQRETRLNYDAQLRLNEIRLPNGAVRRCSVDVLGRILEETDPDGNRTRYDYTDGPDNPRGALRSIVWADGSRVRTRYNGEGLPVEFDNPLGLTIRRTYGPFDLLIGSIDTAGYATQFEYDHATRLTKVVNALGEAYEYRYDGAGRLAAEVDWGGRTTVYERDAAGRLIIKTLPDGTQWRYAYDALDRVVEIDAGDVKLVYCYDGRGRLASAEVQGDAPHVTHFAYDEHGRLIGENQHGELLRYAYDGDGLRTLRATPRRETKYAYDALGALTQVGRLTIARDSAGRETDRQAGAFIAHQEYDALGRLLKQVAGPGAAFESLQSDPAHALAQLTRQIYRYDAAGQLEQVEADGDTLTYRRDVRGQVTNVRSLLQPGEHYRYDAVLNIAAHGQQAAVDTHQYAAGGLPERVGFARYRYDARGRTIEKTVERHGFRPQTWHYTWDGLNRLVKVATPEQGVWVYRYDAFNRRVEKRPVGGHEAVKFLWDGPTIAERWIEKRDGTTGQAVTWHVEPGSFAPLAQETDDGLYPVLTDQVGMPKAVFDECGAKVWKASFSLWGALLPTRAAANQAARDIDTTLRFPGQWADDESGLHYNLNRYYDPDSGQYLSLDPIGLEGGLRTQGYVADPLGEFDPLGLATCNTNDSQIDKGLSGRGVRPGPGERSLTKEQYRELMRNRNQGDALQAALDQKIASQDYVYRATTWRAVENYRKQGSISGYKGAGTYMSTDYVGTNQGVLMDRGQVFQHWGAPDVLLKIPTSELSSATVPRPLGGKLPVGWEPETSFYPAAGSGGQNQFMGTTKSWSDDWIVPVDK
ncbi:RHS repeat-associated core domain-containing protein [Burkholderia sp. BCC0405]|uniref:RHS repeat-associated core domain-containing protein n=1 Tax=Burkholderia sp. BCC0405 TaxID=2676298 RepID=UPI00158B7F2A|nr:RHS repeat-associated core domain-containing protein [Burkholderia sp. BCC0405]